MCGIFSCKNACFSNEIAMQYFSLLKPSVHLCIHFNEFFQVFLVEDPTFIERKCFFSDVLDKSLQLPKPKESSMYHLTIILLDCGSRRLQ